MSSTAATIAKASRSGGAQPTIEGSVYVKPQDIEWEPTQFPGNLDQDPVRGQGKRRVDVLFEMGAGRDSANAQASRDRAELRC